MDDRRLIEEFLPIIEISAESSREKSIRHGHISTIHLWWARRPLVACRAALYASLVSADFHAPNRSSGQAPKNGDPKKHKSLARANASKFLKALCKYPGDPKMIELARQHIRAAHKARTGSDEPPKVLDCFAGGGAIPLEALRLGCDAYALDLNPVAHLIELCTLVYPQKFGQPDSSAVGCDSGKWGGLAKEVEHWGKWVLENVKKEVGHLYPVLTQEMLKRVQHDVEKGRHPELASGSKSEMPKQVWHDGKTTDLFGAVREQRVGYNVLIPAAYLWTRTVPCKNPGCRAIVSLVRQTWLCKKSGRYIALRVTQDATRKRPRFSVVQSARDKEKDAIQGFGFDPSEFSKGGNAGCVHCGTIADSGYVKQQAQAGKMSRQLMAVVFTREGKTGKVYIGADSIPDSYIPNDYEIQQRIARLCEETGLTPPDEPLVDKAADQVPLYGMTNYGQLFTPRQLLTLLTFVKWVRKSQEEIKRLKYGNDQVKAVSTNLAMCLDRVCNQGNMFTIFNVQGEKIENAVGDHALPMTWDFPEVNPLGNASGNANGALEWVRKVLAQESNSGHSANVIRGSATELPYENQIFDAVVTDPPYYDNISYASLSDFFYVWLKRSVGEKYPEHFAAEASPKKNEVIADQYRHGSKDKAKRFYEELMLKSLREINRVLKQHGIFTMVYAHKTVAGWTTLLNALRQAGFTVLEAWPIETERKRGKGKEGEASLTSSIFIVSQKRDPIRKIATYGEVRTHLEDIVEERVQHLWEGGISGADLIIACVGAGLKAFTQYERVELPNGEEVKPERFLSEVEGVVQDTILEYLFGSRTSVSTVDTPTRFYILWRYAYGGAEIDAGEAIVFSYPLGVELDGVQGLSNGSLSLLEHKGKKYRLRDFTERGDEEKLGYDGRFGTTIPPLIDVLHRLLWLMENRTVKISEFLDSATPDSERLRLVAQALAGSALQGGGSLITTDAEHGALQKLVSNWSSIFKEDLLRRR